VSSCAQLTARRSRRCEETRQSRATFALALAVERLENRARFTHLLAVVWPSDSGEERLTVGIGRTWAVKTIHHVWRSLTPWKHSLGLNVNVARAWARDPKQERRIELAVTRRPSASAAVAHASSTPADATRRCARRLARMRGRRSFAPDGSMTSLLSRSTSTPTGMREVPTPKRWA